MLFPARRAMNDHQKNIGKKDDGQRKNITTNGKKF